MDLVLVIMLSLLLAPLALLGDGPFRIVLGLLFLLFFPGYALMAALFPKKGQFDTVEFIALSFGLSIAIVPLIGLILNYTPWGIRLDPILICITLFIIIASSIALYRRRRLPEEERFEPRLRIKLPNWRGQSNLGKVLLPVVLVAILAGVGTIGYAIAAPRVEERFTEFYVVGSGGIAEGNPRELALGEEGTVILGIVNHEHQSTDYSVEINIDGEKVQEIGPIGLAPKGKSEQPVSFLPSKPGEDQRVEFLLYKNDESEPYLELLLWLDVKEAE